MQLTTAGTAATAMMPQSKSPWAPWGTARKFVQDKSLVLFAVPAVFAVVEQELSGLWAKCLWRNEEWLM